MNLFNYSDVPLAYKYRPNSIEDFYGQDHIKEILLKLINKNHFVSSIFYGPTGSGKTTLAKIIANTLDYDYIYLNATKASKNDIIEITKKDLVKKTLVFLDEIHRFNKLQQDSLLEDLENGNILLIAATTENPFYNLNSALISRCLTFEFKKLSNKNIEEILKKIILNENLNINKEVISYIANSSNGDARIAINILETLIKADLLEIDLEQLQQFLSLKVDTNKYNLISALIKSIRGSDVNSAIYWLAALLKSGEDIEYIGRRLVILASEDIGLANPNAAIFSNSILSSIKEIGMPEARILLSECVIYLALSPKSNSSYLAINTALEYIENNGIEEVPFHLKKVGSSKYLYPHDYDNNYVKQKYLNKKIRFFEFSNNKIEQNMKQIWEKIRKENYDE